MEIKVKLSIHFKGKLFRTNIVMLRADSMLQSADWFETADKNWGVKHF